MLTETKLSREHTREHTRAHTQVKVEISSTGLESTAVDIFGTRPSPFPSFNRANLADAGKE